MRVAIVGAGMAGLACAGHLRGAGLDVVLYDKGRGAGGRMATRRMTTVAGEAAFDHGAQYFTVRDPGFADQVRAWQGQGHAAPWPDAGDDAWVGTPRMSAVIRSMADGQDMRFGTRVDGLSRDEHGWHVQHSGGREGAFDAIVIAVPAEQAAPLLSLHDFSMAQTALRARSQPCWTGMFAFAEPLAAPDMPIRDRGAISWAVRNRAKPGRTGPESWVVQAQPAWSRERLEYAPERICEELLAHLAQVIERPLPLTIGAQAHRWRFAMSSGTGDEALWNEDESIGACGDWLIAPRVECAWLSGQALAERILRT